MADLKTIARRLDTGAINTIDRDNSGIRVYGQLSKTSGSRPVQYRFYPSLRDRSTFLELEPNAIRDVSGKDSNGFVEISKQSRKFVTVALLLAASGCIAQLPNPGGMRPLVATPTSHQVSDCRHIRNLHDLFSISSAGLVAASGASGVGTIAVGSSSGKTVLAITSAILGALGALAIKGTSTETNDYISDYPFLGGCPAILGALDTPALSSSDTGSASVFGGRTASARSCSPLNLEESPNSLLNVHRSCGHAASQLSATSRARSSPRRTRCACKG